MADPSYLMIVVGALGVVWTGVRFLADTRYLNSDELGASIRFDRSWMISALALSVGVALRPDAHWVVAPIIVAGAYAAILPLKWRVIRPLGRFFGHGREIAPGTEPNNGFARLTEIERLVGGRPEA